MKDIYKILQFRKINNLDPEIKEILSFLMNHIESEEKIKRNLRLEVQLLKEIVQSFEKRDGYEKWMSGFKKIKTFLWKSEEGLRVSS
ncbi:MAG: hypothetical protein B7Y25_02145 [Alphaproteobacteria bacterium 16-39-46]|nr:MAG: hypothetical protein B7Y25_02145 [Alphaproteobacteria bacterium 16-39-46]OZA43706.1 MAG: hypothetical protein B7X84_02395 [Alphaproteobacteria bacterium 17-39-52]HQS83642.1 hypothetical protein [Alphaproteobacteria bacterium]HQS93569.1 hypothetical protein [Alphaproteobacteria bacterium]